jgi:LAO/AO transport system kinase
VIQLLDAAGYARVLVETVGAGQTEVEIAGAAHTTIVVEAPGMGDEVQAFKAGLLEIADVLAVNKADRDGAERTVLALQAMQALTPAAPGHHGLSEEDDREPLGLGRQPNGAGLAATGWLPPIVKTRATTGEGIETLREWVEAHAAYLHATGAHARREAARAEYAVRSILSNRLTAALLAGLPDGLLEEIIEGVARRDVDPNGAVDQLLAHHIRRERRSPSLGGD